MKIIFKKDYTSRKYMIVKIHLEASWTNLEKKGQEQIHSKKALNGFN